MASTRRLWAENLHAYVFVGEFVHVKETAGWDAGKLKVYQVRSSDSLVEDQRPKDGAQSLSTIHPLRTGRRTG